MISKQAMFMRIVLKSLNGKKSKLVAGFIALFLASLLVSALLAVVIDLPSSLGKELRTFGANYEMESKNGLFGKKELKKLDSGILKEAIVAYAPFANIDIRKRQKTYKLNGTDLKSLKKLSPWIRLKKTRLKVGEVIAGKDVADKLGLKIGDDFTFTNYLSAQTKGLQKTECLKCHDKSTLQQHESRLSPKPPTSECLEECHEPHETRVRKKRKMIVAGIISGGGDEDKQFFADSGAVFKISTVKGFKIIRLSVLSSMISQQRFESLIKSRFENAKLKSIKQISKAEKSLLFKIRMLMTLLTIVVLMTAGLSVAATLSVIMTERRTEIGLMKAIGATHTNIMVMFVFELLAIALVAGILGYFGGLALAFLLAKVIFKAQISADLTIALFSVASSLVLVSLAGITPVRGALAVQPAVTLRGE